MIRTFLTLALVVAALQAFSQDIIVKASAFYPVPKEFKIKNEVTSNRFIFGSTGCVEGNCKKGQGTFLRVFEDGYMQGKGEKTFLDIRILKGTFREDGKYFEGDVYAVRLDYLYTTTYNVCVLAPVNPFDLTDVAKLEPHLEGKGTMKRQSGCEKNCGYNWSGWKSNTIANAEPGYPKAYAIYYDLLGERSAQKLVYAPGGVYKEFTGRTIHYDEIVGGRFLYTDNTTYEGFVFRGKFFGPGVFTSASGEKKQGVWMMDTLTMPMEIKFPEELFDPTIAEKPNMPQYKLRTTSVRWSEPLYNHYAGPDGWVLGTNKNKIFFGKTEGQSFDGPGVMIEFKPDDYVYTYWTGIFTEGVLNKGMRVTYNVRNAEPYMSVISGEFEDGKLVEGCNRHTTYDYSWKPISIIEGMFYPSANWDGEVISGWAYVNDWAGLREEKNLRYFYSNRSVFSEGFTPEWWIDAAEEAVNAPYCFPKIVTQRDAILKKLIHKGDSMLARRKAAEADRARLAEARKKAAQKSAACMQKLNNIGIDMGVTVTDGNFIGYVSDVDCENETLTIVNPGNKYANGKSPEKRTVTMFGFSSWRRNKLQYRTCPECNGMCGESRTVTTSKTKELPFGYFSGITTTITKTKTETLWVMCPRCHATGLSLE